MLPINICVGWTTLDDIIVHRAKKTPNAELREGAQVEKLLLEDDHIREVKWNESNRKGEATAKVVIGADGVRLFVTPGSWAFNRQEL